MASDLEPFDPSTLRALDAERRRADVGGELGDRLLGRVMASVAVGAAVTATATAAAAGAKSAAATGTGAAAAAGTAKILPWIIGAFLVGGGSGAALHAALTSVPAARETPVVVTAPPAPPPLASAVAPPATVVVPAMSVGELPSAPMNAPKPSAAPAESAAGHDVDLAAERALVDRARTALTRGQSGPALEALDAHAKSYPRGRLAEEREALAVDALARTGRTEDARARAARFRAAYPNSMFAGVVDNASPR